MTYLTNTITNANPGATLYGVMETAMLALGWTLEDTVVIGARTHKILKSAAAGNARGVDWWIDISYTTTGAGTLMMAPFEGYTPAGDTGLRGPYATNDTQFETTNYSRYGATQHALETNWANTTGHTGLQTPLITTAFVYHLAISRDRVALILSNAGSYIHYCGFFTPTAAALAHQGASCVPLIVTRIFGGSAGVSSTSAPSVTAAVTRLPKYPDLGASRMNNGWGGSVYVFVNQAMSYGVAGQEVHPANGEISFGPVYVLFGTVSLSSITGGLVGYLDGVLSGQVATSESRGDTITQGADTYVLTQHSGQIALGLKTV